ncbi:unannotated protein [freshwater metagenome]|uniref:tRNA (guanine(46)-N(7))-methyltransferase n=1 Tax=freshwater metagenome TaxID=449393 RepID=A0A6J7XVB5_9ZZZZ|nr:tRNA (guanosine(46)-N7)-methyltransferase TrmB [Actinomycetota bacterium]
MERLTIKSYKARGTRITPAQSAARVELWTKYGIENDHAIDPQVIFPTASEIIVEIGYGMGEATATIAREFPQNGYFAIEVHQPGIGKLITILEEHTMTNVKLIDADAHEVLEDIFPNKSVDGVHLFFPDPWPKSRHHKRRIVNEGFLELISKKIKQGGYIHIATDWQPYAVWIQEVFEQSNLFSGGEVERPKWRPPTRFEKKGLSKDHEVSDFRYFLH